MNSRRKNLFGHAIIIRYDFESSKWVHSAGIVVTPREVAVLEMLARSPDSARQCGEGALSASNFYDAQAKLKAVLGLKPKCSQDHSKLLKIAMDLYGST